MTLLKSGEQLLRYLECNPRPDLILLDIDMPQMNGIEAAEKVIEMTEKTVPILFVSALCDSKTVMACRELDVSGYIVRPYQPVYIREEIQRVLSRWEVS